MFFVVVLGCIFFHRKPHTVGVTTVMKESVESASYCMSPLQHFSPFYILIKFSESQKELWPFKDSCRINSGSALLPSVQAEHTLFGSSSTHRTDTCNLWDMSYIHQHHSFTETCLCVYVNYEQVLHTQAFIHIAVIPYFLHSVNLLKLCKSCFYHHYCHVHPLS